MKLRGPNVHSFGLTAHSSSITNIPKPVPKENSNLSFFKSFFYLFRNEILFVPDFYTLVLNSSSGKLLRNVMEIKLEKRFDHWVETAAGRY